MALDDITSGSVGLGRLVGGTVFGRFNTVRAFAGDGSLVASASVFALMLSKKNMNNGS
jgi:hypothetical protein